MQFSPIRVKLKASISECVSSTKLIGIWQKTISKKQQFYTTKKLSKLVKFNIPSMNCLTVKKDFLRKV